MNRDLISQYLIPLSPIPTSLDQRGSLNKKIRCLLFDIYGTLFISGAGEISISKKDFKNKDDLKKLLQQFGIKATLQAVLKNLFDAIEKSHEESRSKGIDFPEVEIDKIWMSVIKENCLTRAREFAVLYELIVSPVYPMPHANELFAACKKVNFPMGIISNAQFYTKYLFDWFFCSAPERLGFFSDLIFYSFKSGYAKPSVFMFNLAADKLKKMGIPADSVLYIGNDMLNDIYPAKKAGFKTALFAGDDRSLRIRKDNLKCTKINADLVITDLLQLQEYI